MCRVYGKTEPYVRLCYRIRGRRGEHVPFEGKPPLGPTGHYAPGGRTKIEVLHDGPRPPRGCIVTFRVPEHTPQETIDDMGRYAHAQVTHNKSHSTITLLLPRSSMIPAITSRAASFGWRPLVWTV